MMKECTYGATLEELLKRPMGHLALVGRDGDDEGAKPKGAESEDEENSDDDDDQDDDQDKSKDGKSKDEEDNDPASLRRKLANSEEARNRNADKRKELVTEVKELKAKIAQMEKDGTPDDAIKTRNEELEKDIAKVSATNQNLMLQIAMRDDKAHTWVDPDAALRLADLSEVEFDEKTLRPIGLKAALDKLAKEKPYLLKKDADGDDDDSQGRRGGSTGRRPAPRRQNQGEDAARAAKLRAKYPGLRR